MNINENELLHEFIDAISSCITIKKENNVDVWRPLRDKPDVEMPMSGMLPLTVGTINVAQLPIAKVYSYLVYCKQAPKYIITCGVTSDNRILAVHASERQNGGLQVRLYPTGNETATRFIDDDNTVGVNVNYNNLVNEIKQRQTQQNVIQEDAKEEDTKEK